jgi:hypothetical protein
MSQEPEEKALVEAGEAATSPKLPRPDWDLPAVRLEMTSPVERGFDDFLGLGCLITMAALFAVPFGMASGVLVTAFPLYLLGALGRWVFRGDYFLDRGSSELRYRRRIGPSVREEAVARLEDVAVVTVRGQSKEVEGADGEPSREWSYRLLVMLQDGTSIPVSDETKDLTDANDLAGELARELEVPLVPGRSEQVLEHVPEAKLPEVIRTQTQAGAEAERLVGHGIFVTGMSYLTSLPALAFPGAWTYQAIQALLAGGGSLAAVAGYTCLTLVGLILGLPASVAAVRLLRQAAHRPSTEEKSKEVEDEGFEDGLELWLFLMTGNLLAASASWIGGAWIGVDPTIQVGSWALMNLAIWFSWAFTGLSLPKDGPTAIPESVRIHLLGALEHRQARCGYCGVTIVPEEVVACNTCEALHHQECWDEFGSCTTFGCGSTAASPVVL